MYLLGYDIGSSSVKAALVHTASGQQVAVVQSPAKELNMIARQPGWAEQQPEVWWQHLCLATRQLLQQTQISAADIQGIGVAYQMHGLVLVDEQLEVLRPAIIWCDSRATSIGEAAWHSIGQEKCLFHLLNSPGNFTASKLKWVQDNEPGLYARIHKIMLPGDYIAMRLTGEVHTTISGLSEAILWDFQEHTLARMVLDHYAIDVGLVPDVVPTFSLQGRVTKTAAKATGLAANTPITYRAGDQPNNAMALNVLEAGDVAATGGTSGVVYGVVDRPVYDSQSRVNAFAHVNHQAEQPRIGVLLCINGAGIQYRWLQQQTAPAELTYAEMEHLAATVPPGADGLRILPFGNGAERMLNQQSPGAQIHNLQFNRHGQAHLYRAALEGIAFSFVYGVNIMKNLGLDLQVIRVGNDNLFQSPIFAQTIAQLLDSQIELIDSTGAIGAAKAAGVASGAYTSIQEAMQGNTVQKVYTPLPAGEAYHTAYRLWLKDLSKTMTPNP